MTVGAGPCACPCRAESQTGQPQGGITGQPQGVAPTNPHIIINDEITRTYYGERITDKLMGMIEYETII